MKQRFDLRFLVRVLTPVFIIALGLGAVFDYQRSTRGAEERFNEKQAFMAQQAAERLSEVFREMDKLFVLLGNIPRVVQSREGGQHMLATVVAQLQEHGAILAARVDTAGQVRLTAGTTVTAAQRLVHQVRACVGAQGICVSGPLRSTLARSGWLLLVTSDLPVNAGGRLLLGLDWAVLRQHISNMSSFGKGSYSWVLDHHGRLIMHPQNYRQLGQPALAPGKTRAGSHTSLAVHREMKAGKTGTARFQVADQEPTLVAFTPLTVGRHQWSLAVATPARLVTAAARRDLTSTILFTGAIMLVMVAGALLLDREASRRVRTADDFNRSLEQEVRRRTDELSALYRRLGTLQTHHTRLERVAVAGEMAAIVAHEIRTPLNALSINAQMISRMLRRDRPGSKSRALEVLGTLQAEIQRINQLVQENLLAHARPSRAELAPLRVRELLEDSVRFMEPEALRHDVELKLEIEPNLPCARADESRLRQVLLNIILNAVQAMPDGGAVRLRAGSDGEQVRISIEDTGPGIEGLDADNLHQVFRPFVTTKKHGTGLGLAICARLVKEMGGSIGLCSEQGQGACFSISLPVEA